MHLKQLTLIKQQSDHLVLINKFIMCFSDIQKEKEICTKRQAAPGEITKLSLYQKLL